MVKLKNIVIEQFTVKCDLYPEDSGVSGHIAVDVRSGKLLDFKLPLGYEWCRSHVHHAHDKLLAITKQDGVPQNEIVVMWY